MSQTNTIAPRRWWLIMPVIFITYSLAYLDRSNYSLAAAAGMAKDLRIDASMASLIGALFFLGYFFFQIPGALYAQRQSVRKLVFVSLILWGGCAALTGVAKNATWLLAIRFLLGMVEAAVFPAMLILLTEWFTKSERSRANTFLILGNPVTVLWMSIVSGYLIQIFNWRIMFIAEGLPAIVWAVFWWLLVRDRPSQVGWMSDGDKAALEAQLSSEQTGLKTIRTYGEAFKSKNVIMLCGQYFFWSVGVYGFVLWLPSILKAGKSMAMVETGWLSAAPYLLAVIGMLAASWLSDRRQSRKIFVWPFLLVGALAFAGSFLLGASHFWLSYTLLVIAGGAMYAPYGPFFAIIPEMLPRNVAGGAMALINSMGALGSFVGSYFVGYLNGVTGGPGASYVLMAGGLVLAAVLTILVKPDSARD